jgi:hypothetical protein
VVKSFTPIQSQENPTEMSEMKVGCGLLAHPDYPNNPLFFKLVFQWETIYPDGKTLYRIEESGGGIYYLKKVE